jgi:sugar O-acyltransferase (sialic acid O-acetyltransferase NeuD family)
MYIYGASGQARVIIDMIDTTETVHGVFDDNPELKEVLGYPVQHGIPPHFEFDQPFFIAIGENKARKDISQKINGKARFATIVHPSALVSKRAEIGEGTVIMEGVIVKVNCTLGKQVIVNTGASVDHDCLLGDFVHLAPQATLCGDISIGEGTIIGANALILPRVNIGSWCKIGAGSIVTKDVPDGGTWIGTGLK